MQNKKCSKIKNLEKQLKCLEDKYKSYTVQLKRERDLNMISDEYGDYYNLLQRRVHVLKQMDIVRLELKKRKHRLKYQPNENVVQIGSRVVAGTQTVRLEFELTQEYTANPDENLISVTSPLGRAVLGKRVGESFQIVIPTGKKYLRVDEIRV